jgi:hypothetical protein
MKSDSHYHPPSVQIGKITPKWGIAWISIPLLILVFFLVSAPNFIAKTRFGEPLRVPEAKYLLLMAPVAMLFAVRGRFRLQFLGNPDDTARVSDLILGDKSLRIISKSGGELKIGRIEVTRDDLPFSDGSKRAVRIAITVQTEGNNVTVEAGLLKLWTIRRLMIEKFSRTLGAEEQDLV